MTEAHPIFPETPQVRTSIPLPENRLQQSSNCIPMNNLMAHVYQNVIFPNRNWHSDDFGIRSLVIQKNNFWRKRATFIVERDLS